MRVPKVLIACEESQAVCIEMRRIGLEAYSADIQEPSGGHPEWHILGDVLPIINGDCTFTTMDGQEHRIDGEWDLIIAHPPCTYMANSGAVRMRVKGKIVQERYEKAMRAKEFFMSIYNAKCQRIAIENPTPMKLIGLPDYSQAIQPYWFGHPYSKRTCLWLKNLPCLFATEIVENHEPYVNGGFKDENGKILAWNDPRTAKARSKTFLGIARAFAEQYGKLLLEMN